MYNILIVGCGYVGTRIGAHFAEKKQRVYGLLRSKQREAELREQGIEPFYADLTKPETLKEVPAAHFVVICPAPGERSLEAYESTYIRGIKNYLNAIPRDKQPYLITYLSSTGVYGPGSGEIVDEETLLKPDSDRGKVLVQAERQVLGCDFPAAVLRLAGIYGPGRNRVESYMKDKTSLLPKPLIPKEGEVLSDSWMNLIHVDDIVGVMKTFFERAKPEEVYLGCDGSPVKRSKFYGWLAGELNCDAPEFDSSIIVGKQCMNEKLKGLGYEFQYPDYKTGYGEIIKQLRINS